MPDVFTVFLNKDDDDDDVDESSTVTCLNFLLLSAEVDCMSSKNIAIHLWLKKFTKVGQKLLKVLHSTERLLKTSKVAKKLPSTI